MHAPQPLAEQLAIPGGQLVVAAEVACEI